MRKLILVAAVLVLAPVLAEDKVKSGLEKGAKMPAFDVVDVTGPNTSKEKLCYRCGYGDKPVVILFANETSPAVGSLARKVDSFVKENKKAGAEAFVVLMGDKNDANKDKLKKFAKENKIEIPVTISFDQKEVSSALKLNNKVKYTVLVYNKGTVNENFAKNEITEKDIESILAAAKANVKS